MLLLARLMDWHNILFWSLASVVCRCLLRCRRAGASAAGRVDGRVADSARRAITVTSR